MYSMWSNDPGVCNNISPGWVLNITPVFLYFGKSSIFYIILEGRCNGPSRASNVNVNIDFILEDLVRVLISRTFFKTTVKCMFRCMSVLSL